jgi:hypothetical protein
VARAAGSPLICYRVASHSTGYRVAQQPWSICIILFEVFVRCLQSGRVNIFFYRCC